MTVNAYPLSWPVGWKRTAAHQRVFGRFGAKGHASTPGGWRPTRDLTVNEAVNRVRVELDRLGVKDDDVVISTNVPLRLDGLPRSDARQPDDPGAAVYWQRRGEPMRCMAIDQYVRVYDNLAAIAATLEAMRAIERHGGAAILDRAFTGFAALPAPGAERSWREVLGIEGPGRPALDVVKDAYRRLASQHHPDRGGDPARMAEINRAWEQAQEALR